MDKQMGLLKYRTIDGRALIEIVDAQTNQLIAITDDSDMAMVRMLSAAPELTDAVREFTSEDLSDVKALSKKLDENNHRVTGTEAERIMFLLRYLERSARFARATLLKAQL